jgi:hypothetical protein
MSAALELAGALTLITIVLYLLYEGAALLEEEMAKRAKRNPRFITISEIVRPWALRHRGWFLLVVVAWLGFGIWFAGHILLGWGP